jgi:transposase InsO family protein
MRLEQSSGRSLSLLCLLSGHSRQAYYKHRSQAEREPLREELIVQQVLKHRSFQPRIGGRKLYLLTKGFLVSRSIKMGMDAFFKLLGKYDLLNKRRRHKVRTTNSTHWMKKHPDLVKGMVPTASNHLWVSDITYLELAHKDAFLSLVTDAYSRKIVGFHLSNSLAAEGTVKALKMAICGRKEIPGLIHHSDRGGQYCCNDYVKELTRRKISISMTQSGDPRDNAIAERVNGILKMELLEPVYQDLYTARKAIEQAVNTYNYLRPHSSISMLAPALVHGRDIPVKRRWKNYYRNANENRQDLIINKSEGHPKRKKEAKKEKTHQDMDNAARSPHPDTTSKQLIT